MRLDHLLSREIRVMAHYGEVMALMAPRLIARSHGVSSRCGARRRKPEIDQRLGETP